MGCSGYLKTPSAAGYMPRCDMAPFGRHFITWPGQGNKKDFKTLLTLAASDPLFQFNNVFYNQTDGVAMGSPLGPTLANIFMSHHEQIWLQNCPVSFKPLSYYRYVDDTFTVFSRPEHCDSFLSYLNAQHTNIKFTAERQVDNSIPFLDTNVTLSNSTFSVGIFRKATFTGLGSSFYSNIPSKYNINAIKTLIHRAYTLTSSYLSFDLEVKFLGEFFSKNGYPESVFDNQLWTVSSTELVILNPFFLLFTNQILF